MPELEFGQASYKGFELLIVLRGKRGRLPVFHVGVGLERRVELGADEGQEEVEEVDAERICDWPMC